MEGFRGASTERLKTSLGQCEITKVDQSSGQAGSAGQKPSKRSGERKEGAQPWGAWKELTNELE